MAPITVRPTQVDVEIADAIAAHTGPRTEQAAELITWGADEHVLCALAVGWWLYSRSGESASRCASNHVLMTTLVSSALPHILKKMFDQERPDRLTVRAIGVEYHFPESGSTLFRLATPCISAPWHRLRAFFPAGNATRCGRSVQGWF